jgi:anti-anti-sigma factor
MALGLPFSLAASSTVEMQINFNSRKGARRMATRITQIDEGGQLILKVEGSLDLADARLLTKVCLEAIKQPGRNITIDLKGLSYLNSASAAVLCCLKHQFGIALQGTSFFVQQVLDLTEKSFIAIESNSS